jgi:hypothetical protein
MNKSVHILTKNKAPIVNLKFLIFVTAAILDEHQCCWTQKVQLILVKIENVIVN